LGGATIGKTIFTYGYTCIEKNLLQNQQTMSIKLGINHPWVKGILNCSNKGPGPLQRGDNCKNGVGSFKKSSSSEPLSQNRSSLHETFLI
jgi:hypothetical protein